MRMAFCNTIHAIFFYDDFNMFCFEEYRIRLTIEKSK